MHRHLRSVLSVALLGLALVVDAPPAFAATHSYTGPPVPIPDGNSVPATAVVTVGGEQPSLSDINLRIGGSTCSATSGSTAVGIDHTWVGDLTVGLRSPAGTTVTLIRRTAGSGNNFCQTLLDDDAGAPSIQAAVSSHAPFTGTWAPANPLSAFDGENPNGNWTLTVQDHSNVDSGSIRAFSLIITSVTCAAPPAFSIGDVTLAEGDAGATPFTFTITRSGDTTCASKVDWSTLDGSAVAPDDYTAVGATTVYFASGDTSKTVALPVMGDPVVESNDGFTVNLSNPVGATISDGVGVGRITNDDVATFAVDDVTVAEGDAGTTTATFTVTRTGALGGTATVMWRTLDVHATAGTDYVAVSPTTLTFAPAETTRTAAVTVNGDTTVEPTEDYYVRLSSPTGATIADATGVGVITNDDVALVSTVSIGDATVTEGDAGSINATFTVTRSGDLTALAAVDLQTQAGTATSGVDFTPTSGTVNFAAGDTTGTVSVPVLGDTAVEANETFTVRLSNPVAVTIVDGSGLGRITNDDASSLAIGDATVVEGDAGPVTATFTVTRSGATGGPASVTWSTANGTATAGSDYGAVGPTVVAFGPGDTSKTVSVTVDGDTAPEANETFRVTLTSPSMAGLADPSGLGRITNDD